MELDRNPDFLSQLSNEVLGCIVDHVGAADLCSLRQTSRTMRDNSTKRFAEEHFQRINVIMSRRSLTAAVNLARHPTFGPYVYSITMTAKYLAPTGLITVSNNNRQGIPNVLHRGTDMERTGYIFNNKFHEQRLLESTGQGLSYLCQLLNIIRTYGHPIGLTMTDLDESLTPVGDHKYWNNLEPECAQHWVMNRLSTIRLLFLAVYLSGCRIESLRIVMSEEATSRDATPELLRGIFTFWRHASFSVEDINANNWPIISSVCRYLSDITIDFGGPSYTVTEETITALANMLHHSTVLTHIGLALGGGFEVWSYWEDMPELQFHPCHAFHEMTSAILSPFLSELTLHQWDGIEDDLIKLLKKHQKSIKVLDMHVCALLEGERWSRVLLWIVDNMMLERLWISELSILVEALDLKFLWFSVNMLEFQVSGFEEIETGLRKKLPRLEREERKREDHMEDFEDWDNEDE